MSKDNGDVSSDLGSLLGELAKAKAEEQKKKQEKVEELNNDSSFANMMAELSQVAKVTKVKEPEKKKLLVEPEKKKEKEVTTKEEKQGLLQQLSQLAVETKTPIVKLEKEESYEIGKDYADHTKEVTPGQTPEKKKKKSDFIISLSKNLDDYNEIDVSLSADIIQNAIIEALKKRKRVEIRGFGSFSVRDRLSCSRLQVSL